MSLRGMVLGQDGLVPSEIHLENGRIVEVEPLRNELRGKASELVLMPTLVNAHTHMGDAFIGRPPRGLSVEQLVGPPNGLKHRRLREADDSTKIIGMVSYLWDAHRSGISRMLDFREEGAAGIALARKAIEAAAPFWNVKTMLLGRATVKGSLTTTLRVADGLGLSSLSDVGLEEARSWRRAAAKENKPFAMHVSESRREPIDRVLALRPDLMIHLCKASSSDLEQVAAAKVPVAICPRANHYFGLRPPVRKMLDLGIRVCVGTDNAMLATPDLLAEARLLTRSQFGALAPMEALRVAVLEAQGLLTQKKEGIVKGAPADFLRMNLPRASPSRILRGFLGARSPLGSMKP